MEFIPDKKMYAAVMGACSYIRATGWFNKAVSYYAKKYDVDPEELAKHIRQRQSEGQKKASKYTSRKYLWYVVREYTYTTTHGYEYDERSNYKYCEPDELKIIRATNEKNATKSGEPVYGFQNESCAQEVRDLIKGPFESKAEATKYFEEEKAKVAEMYQERLREVEEWRLMPEEEKERLKQELLKRWTGKTEV